MSIMNRYRIFLRKWVENETQITVYISIDFLLMPINNGKNTK